jgi:hypothetical protein
VPDLAAVGSIFALAFFYFWPAIPAGLALGLSPLIVIATTSLSYISGVVLVVVVGGRFRQWVMNRLGRDSVLNPETLLGRTWTRFGVIGLGLLAPMTIGSQMGAGLGVTLDNRPMKVLLWMCIGGVVWSMILTALVTAGVLGAQAVVN